MDKIIESLDYMFGFIFKQPIHKSLRQLRLVSIIAICLCWYLLYEMWGWYSANADINQGGDVAFWGFAGAVLGIFWKAVSAIAESHKDDD